jgi:pyruvate kinase
MTWGVTPLPGRGAHDTDGVVREGIERALATGLVHKGDSVIITAGVHVEAGATNLIEARTL